MAIKILYDTIHKPYEGYYEQDIKKPLLLTNIVIMYRIRFRCTR